MVADFIDVDLDTVPRSVPVTSAQVSFADRVYEYLRPGARIP